MIRRFERLALIVMGLTAGMVHGVHALPPQVQQVLTERQARWSALSPVQQAQVRARAQSWDALPHQERTLRRSRYLAWRALDDAQRAQLRTAAQAFAQLPAPEQARLRTRYAQLDGMHQQGWQLGVALGADWPRLQPLFAYVPPDERMALLAVLRQLDAAQRDDLAALAQRIPPQERQAFRQALLAVNPAERAAWLRQRRNQ